MKLKVEGLLMNASNNPSYSSKTDVDEFERLDATKKSVEA